MRTPRTDLVFSRAAIRELDRRAIADYGIPGIVLMENAARGVAMIALQMLAGSRPSTPAKAVLIAGGGNNGGDAFAAARHLHNAGVDTITLALRPFDTHTGDALINLNIIRAMKLTIIEADARDPVSALDSHAAGTALLIDGLFGTGLTGPVRPPFDNVIAWMNRFTGRTLSIDIPSGLDCDTGEPLGCAVNADAIATFVGLKLGFTTKAGRESLGAIHVVDIGAPRELADRLRL